MLVMGVLLVFSRGGHDCCTVVIQFFMFFLESILLINSRQMADLPPIQLPPESPVRNTGSPVSNTGSFHTPISNENNLFLTPRSNVVNAATIPSNQQLRQAINEVRQNNQAAALEPVPEIVERAAIAANVAPAALNAVLMNQALAAPIEANQAVHARAALAANAALVHAPMQDHPAVRLIERPRFIARMYRILGQCGYQAVQGLPHPNYDPTWITLIGGSVLTVYDHMLQEYRMRKVERLRALRDYIQNATRDMDVVWCMTNAPNQFQNVPQLVITVGDRMRNQLTQAIPSIQTLIQQEIGEAAIVQIVADNTVIRFGTYAININVQIAGIEPFSICDFTIHNGYSSQQFDDNHLPITDPLPAGADPIYCDENNTMLVPIGDLLIRVPRMDRYLYQQLFAFGNLALHHDVDRQQSSIKNIKRVFYLLRVVGASSTMQNIALLQPLLPPRITIQQFINIGFALTMQKINMILGQAANRRGIIVQAGSDFGFELEAIGHLMPPPMHPPMPLPMPPPMPPPRNQPRNQPRRPPRRGGSTKRKGRKNKTRKHYRTARARHGFV